MSCESVFYIVLNKRGLSVVFHVFYLNMMPFSMPSKLQKGLFFFFFLYNFGRFTRPQTPHFSALEPLKLHLCTLVPLPGTPVSHTPKHHLGCPILPFGVSHFTIWGILRRVYAPILAPFYPLFALISSHFRGKNGRQNVCLSPQLSRNQIPSHQCVTCKPVSEFLYPPLSIF